MKHLPLLFLFLFITYSNVFGVKTHDQTNQLTIYTIPGQNGLGCDDKHVKNRIGKNINIVNVKTPSLMPDLGQSVCMRYLDKVIKQEKKNGIIYAGSQGTATTLNYIAQNKSKYIKAIILESTLASGNSAILHTVTGPLMDMDFVGKIPFSYYWTPYIAKVIYPFYWPAGKQPIKSINNIPKDMPIVIAHSKRDPQLSYNDACALYYGLCMQGNNKVYFISKKGKSHINILKASDNSIIRTILSYHKLVPNDKQMNDVDLKEYQPEYHQFKKQHDDLLFKENIHRYGARFFTLVLIIWLVQNFSSNLVYAL